MSPIYIYECLDCGFSFEVKQSFTEDALAKCERCEGKLTKVIQPATIVYKGAGFATTEFRGITGHKRKPNVTIGNVADLPEGERERAIEVMKDGTV
jgi:putative FmdB family regulatory protein